MKIFRLLYLACIAVSLLSSCQQAKDTHIKIVCTSDVHGHLFPYDFITGDTISGSLARVSSYLKQLRQQGENVIYIDNGDMLQGTPATYCYNTYAIGQTHVGAEALNYLQCEAVVLGNNDIETGGPTYQRYADELNCAVIGGNIVFEDDGDPFLPPYTIIEREGVKVAVIGLTTPTIPYWIPECQWPELDFEDMERSARRWMKYLHEYEQPDIVIGLFHSGYEGGIVTESYAENATLAVAQNVPGFDAIFYGHDHQPRNEKVVNVEGDTVLLLNAGKDAHLVASLDIVFGKKGGMQLEASLVDIDKFTPDEEYMKTFAPHMERIKKYVNRTIGTSTETANTRDALFGSSALVDLIHQMQLDISGAKISFTAPLAYDYTLPEGEVKIRDTYNLYPYENFLYVLWLTGSEIKDYLEMSYSQWISQMTSPDDHLLLFDSSEKELQHPFYHFDSASGIIYEIDVTKPVGNRVSIKSMADGTPFCMNSRYMVAMNSYRAHGGGKLLTDGAGITHEEMLKRIEYTTTADLRFYLLNYIEMKKSITPQPLHQWKFVPERWTISAGNRDRKLLFGAE